MDKFIYDEFVLRTSGSDSEDYDTDSTFCPKEIEGECVFSLNIGNLLDEPDNKAGKCYALPRQETECKRKPKTIFSLELPKQHNATHRVAPPLWDVPGDCGDGYNYPRKRKHPVYDFDGGHSKQPKHEPMLAPTKPFVDSSATCLCRINLPHKTSALALFQSLSTSAASGFAYKPYKGYMELINPTISHQAFKVYCNKSAWSHFTVRPKSGILTPNSRMQVQLKTKWNEHTGELPNNEMVASDSLTVKFFPPYFATECGDADNECIKEKLELFLQILTDQLPNLIHKQTINRIVLRDANHFMTTSSSSVNSVISEDLKKRLFNIYSSQVLPKVERKRLLRNVELSMLVDYHTTRKCLGRFRTIRIVQEIIVFMIICAFIVTYIIPYLKKKQTLLIEPEGWTSFLWRHFYDRLTGGFF